MCSFTLLRHFVFLYAHTSNYNMGIQSTDTVSILSTMNAATSMRNAAACVGQSLKQTQCVAVVRPFDCRWLQCMSLNDLDSTCLRLSSCPISSPLSSFPQSMPAIFGVAAESAWRRWIVLRTAAFRIIRLNTSVRTTTAPAAGNNDTWILSHIVLRNTQLDSDMYYRIFVVIETHRHSSLYNRQWLDAYTTVDHLTKYCLINPLLHRHSLRRFLSSAHLLYGTLFLPFDCISAASFDCFRCRLKSFLFTEACGPG